MSSQKDTKLETVQAPTAVDLVNHHDRLSMPPRTRLPIASVVSFLVGLGLGSVHGGRMTGLRFRAEHAHRLPTDSAGWYLYHKSKNYHVVQGSIREGLKMGAKVSIFGTAMLAIENMFDEYRQQKDMFNAVTAAVTAAGCFSIWNGFTLAAAARTSKLALTCGIVYGGVQDVVFLARGQPIGYVEYLKHKLRRSGPPQSNHVGEKSS